MPDTGNTQSVSAQSSSPRASSSAARQPPAPSYLSARSADVILSEVRPTRIKSEALRSVNVLLDELLWLILGCARSFATDRLRTGLLKVLPTALGKDALLEAEVELRAYIERNPPATPLPTDEPTIQRFPLQQAFELLRIKCEAYSSLGDQEENTDAETALHSRMVQIAGDASPKLSAVAPAALYLTAILEHVCEHVLSNVGRVVARDSSRTTAHAQDLYVALCEDESIYSLFKTMKVQDQIEQQSKMSRPRRSKSFSRNEVGVETLAPGTIADTPALPKPRQSLDSAISNGSNSNLPNRTSVEKSRSKVMFKNSTRPVGDNGNSNNTDTMHRRSNSLLGDKKNSLVLPENTSNTDVNEEISPADDDGSMQDFDDLMRSGTTMKVSLTPDRLKTFEVFAKEKNQRANRPGLPSSSSASSPPSSFPNGTPHLQQKTGQPSRSRNQVEPIAEAPEGEPIRSRAASITSPTTPKVEKSVATPRSRSFTDARAPSARPDVPSSNRRSDSSDVNAMSKRTMPVAVVDPSTGMPKRTRRQPAPNRESIDLDDIMDGSEDDLPIAKKIALTPKSAQTTVSGTRELMDFLSEGPPESPPIATTPSSPAFSESRGGKPGRFRTIVSRLTGSSSTERLSSRPGDDSMDTIHRSATMGINGSAGPLRPQPGSLHSKRSVPNVAAAARPTPPLLSSPPPDSNIPTSGLRARQLSLTRKAVPAWDASKEKAEPSIPNKSVSRQAELMGTTKPLPRPSVSSTSQPSPDDSTDTISPTRKRVPREFDQPTNGHPIADGKPSSPVSSQPSVHPLNGHAKVDQDTVKTNARGSSKTDRRAMPPGLTLSIPAEEHVRDFRRLMARATSADECRVLMDMFLAKCGALPGDEDRMPGPITPPISPIRLEVDNRHESNLIEVLLGDGGTSPTLESLPTPESPVNLVAPSPNHTRPRSQELIEGRSRQPRASPTLTLTPSPVVASTA